MREIEKFAVFLLFGFPAAGLYFGAALTHYLVTGVWLWNVVDLILLFAQSELEAGFALYVCLGGGIALGIISLICLLILDGKSAGSKNKKNSAKSNQANRQLGNLAKFSASLEKPRLKDARTNLHPFAENIGPGLPLGTVNGKTIYQGWRQCAVHIHGTGRGKTSSQVVPHAFVAPGPLVVTSNKPDGIWEVMSQRVKVGRVWVFDPNNVLQRHSSEDKFDILGIVSDSEKAEKIGEIFEQATKGSEQSGMNPNAHFDKQGAKVLGLLMLAARLAGKTDNDVFSWVMKMEEDEPATILRQHGFSNQAEILFGLKKQPGDTRGSVWATAQRAVSPFEHEHLLQAIRPGMAKENVFDPRDFVTSTDTLILIGDKNAGSSAALLSALVYQVFISAKQAATLQPNGRLRVPLVMDLDEMGNAVFLPELADMYTYAGSLGIIINTYFQSKAQGDMSFSADGMKKIIGGAAVFVYGGGSTEPSFLLDVSKLVGTYDKEFQTRSTSYNSRSGHGHSSGVQIQKREILDASDLANLPLGEIYIRNSDGDSGIAKARFWFKDKKMAETVQQDMQQLKTQEQIGV
ncbi:type IV secretory system conjugative DNA transfer family protein [Rothia nasisuis]|uniref:type IV secretory system conjugative DNA transfer family protein n=1 Tax=Rothia nasisuis TaxID=2109647 RepID=UPI001F468E84|nr:type IV secretory system conjugative DNA transfer family protein [Rothia nasisuis]